MGLHFNCHYWGIEEEVQLDKYLAIDRNYLETNLNVIIDTFSFHNNNPFTQSCLDIKYGQLINVYSSYFKVHYYNYRGDSLGYWRFDRLEDVLNDDKVQYLQVLTHDANWAESVMSPRKRFIKAMHDHAERLIDGQINGLQEKGFLCPDDTDE